MAAVMMVVKTNFNDFIVYDSIVADPDLLEPGDEEVDQKDVGYEEENEHTERGHPRPIHTSIGVTLWVRTR